MTSPDDKPSREDLGPDPVTENKSNVFERYEWLFIGFFVALIALGGFHGWRGDRSGFHPISIERGEDSLSMGPVDWSEPLEAQPLDSKDLNQATRSDLLALPGVGPVLAESILKKRGAKGGFRTIDELTEVPGIAERRLESLRPYLHLPEIAAATSSPAPEVRTETTRVEPVGMEEVEIPSRGLSKPDLNSMTIEQLQAIPDIGATYATRILEKKIELGGFQTWDQVGAIHGIGSKRLENLRNHAKLH